MRVTFLTTSFPRFPGDYAGVFVHDLAKALVREGIEVQVLAPHTENIPKRERMDGVQVFRFPYFFPNEYQKLAYGAGIPTNLRNTWMARLQILPFISAFFLNAWMHTKSCDIIHSHWVEPGLIGHVWSKIFHKPHVLSMHRYNPMGQIGQTIYRHVLGHANYVFFNSSFTQQRCLQQISIREGSIIPPGIDLQRFPYKSSKESNSSDSNTVTIFGLGSLLPVKGFIHLVEAMPLILKEINCRVVIGGQGPEYERLRQRAQELGVSAYLTLLGRVSTADVPKFMQQADIFVLPSIPHLSGDNEALGMVLLEAMASGTPCIASRTGGIVDAVDDQITGYLFTPGDSYELARHVITLAQNNPLREKMGRDGRQKVETKFSLPVIANQVKTVYSQILNTV